MMIRFYIPSWGWIKILTKLISLESVKRGEAYRFPGTIARYALGEAENLRQVEILLIWRESSMPSPAEIEAELAALGKALSAVLDWDTTRVRTRHVWMHT